jgi:DNA-binding transcriptional MocR family regulator
MLLLCDDVYDLLSYDDQKLPPRLVELDRDSLPADNKFGNTISNCTMSKLIGPGLRVGWQETPTEVLAAQLATGGAIRSGGTPAQLNTMVVREFLRLGYMGPLIYELRKVFSERSTAMRQALKEHLPHGTQIEGGGGYFYWITLPDGYDTRLITDKCAEQDVILAPGGAFEVDGDAKGWNARAFRACFAYHEAEDIVRGIEIWGRACAQSRS